MEHGDCLRASAALCCRSSTAHVPLRVPVFHTHPTPHTHTHLRMAACSAAASSASIPSRSKRNGLPPKLAAIVSLRLWRPTVGNSGLAGRTLANAVRSRLPFLLRGAGLVH